MTRDDIKSARKLRKLSQIALGKLVKLTASEISRIECGYRDLSEAEAAAIESVLGLAKPAFVAPAVPAPVGLAAAAQIKTGEGSESLPTSALVAKEPIKASPSGSDLSDPANFGVLPELQLLSGESAEDRARLSAELARAQTILHTPRVPAAVWRAWRQFEQQAMERLRSAAATVAPAAVPVVTTANAPITATLATSAATAAASESKSMNSLFVEAARELLPAETTQRLNHAAERARAADPSIGFMKHFRRLAEADLDPTAVKLIAEEAAQRLASPERWRARRSRQRSSDAAK